MRSIPRINLIIFPPSDSIRSQLADRGVGRSRNSSRPADRSWSRRWVGPQAAALAPHVLRPRRRRRCPPLRKPAGGARRPPPGAHLAASLHGQEHQRPDVPVRVPSAGRRLLRASAGTPSLLTAADHGAAGYNTLFQVLLVGPR